MAAPIAGAAKVTPDGKVTQLGPKPAPDATVTAEDVQDSSKLARFIEMLLRDLATLRARWYPRRLDFEDVPTGTSGASVVLAHGFGGRVRWWPVGWKCATNVAPILREDTTSDAGTLRLKSYVAGTVTLRVEEAG